MRFAAVPTYKISIENEEFSSTQDYKCADDIAARRHAVGAVLAIAAEQVPAGKPFFGALVSIEGGSEEIRLIVSVGASPLKNP